MIADIVRYLKYGKAYEESIRLLEENNARMRAENGALRDALIDTKRQIEEVSKGVEKLRGQAGMEYTTLQSFSGDDVEYIVSLAGCADNPHLLFAIYDIQRELVGMMQNARGEELARLAGGIDVCHKITNRLTKAAHRVALEAQR